MKIDRIPRATVQRLAMYVQVLEGLASGDAPIISSDGLARTCGINPAQVRKDLSFFGEFGVRGLGYYVRELLEAIRRVLGVDRPWNVALVGLGNLGRSLLRDPLFPARGLEIVALFDSERSRIGEEIGGLTVHSLRSLPELAPVLAIEIGFIATEPGQAQHAADHFTMAGVRGLVNFSPVRLAIPRHVTVEYVDFFERIFAVTFDLKRRRLRKPRAARSLGDYRQPSFLAWP